MPSSSAWNGPISASTDHIRGRARLYGVIIRPARRDGIDPTPHEGVAAQDTCKRQDRAPRRAVASDRLLCVARAGGMESALPAEPSGQREAVEADYAQQERARGCAARPQDSTDEVHRRVTTRSSNSVI